MLTDVWFRGVKQASRFKGVRTVFDQSSPQMRLGLMSTGDPTHRHDLARRPYFAFCILGTIHLSSRTDCFGQQRRIARYMGPAGSKSYR
jgi:hypothetical protein